MIYIYIYIHIIIEYPDNLLFNIRFQPGRQDPLILHPVCPSAMAEPQRAKIRVTGVVKRPAVPAAEVRMGV